jgi:hypothetical protein
MLTNPVEVAPKGQTSRRYEWFLTTRLPCVSSLRFSSVLRQIPGYNWKGARLGFPNYIGHQPKCFPPFRRGHQSKRSQPFCVQLPHIYPINVTFVKDKLLYDIILPSVAVAPSLNKSRPSSKTSIPLASVYLQLQFIRHCLSFPAVRFVRRNGPA